VRKLCYSYKKEANWFFQKIFLGILKDYHSQKIERKLEFLDFLHVLQKCEKEEKDKELIEWETKHNLVQLQH